jgi:hypothetical protein
MSNENTKPDTGAAEVLAALEPTIPPNSFTPDAQAKRTQLRTLSADFPDEANPVPLTVGDKILASRTPVAALEKAAVFAEAAPAVVAAFANELPELREAVAFELAYAGVAEEGRAYVRRIENAIYRKKLKATRIARAIYAFAKVYMGLDAGDPMKLHVADLQRVLRSRRKKLAPSAEPPKETPKTETN